MLYLIGIGLSVKDISLKAVETIKKCEKVYLENYTNKVEKYLEEIIGDFEILSRDQVENFNVEEAKNQDICLLVSGDPLSATTHIQLMIDCKNAGIKFDVIHSSSIYTAVAKTGLQLYKFGRTTTLTFFEVASPYEVIKKNKENGFHSLVLLDIDNGKCMSAKEAAELLIKNQAVKEDEKIVACSNLGKENEKIIFDSVDKISLEEVPACIIVPGSLNEKEEEALNTLW